MPVVPTKTTVPTLLPDVPFQKEMLVSTTTNDAPKTPDVTKCDDPLKVVQRYKAYFRIESQRYQEGLRPKTPPSKLLCQRLGLSRSCSAELLQEAHWRKMVL